MKQNYDLTPFRIFKENITIFLIHNARCIYILSKGLNKSSKIMIKINFGEEYDRNGIDNIDLLTASNGTTDVFAWSTTDNTDTWTG